MAKCFHHEICGREADENDGKNRCILHSWDPNKDTAAFDQALAEHRKEKGDNFGFFVFPGDVIFSGATFSGDADFQDATFGGNAYFGGATFSGKAGFLRAMFSGKASFHRAKFEADADFRGATFSGDAHFSPATFSGDAHFSPATFSGDAHFSLATFGGDAGFWHATFSVNVHFLGAKFGGDASFGDATFNGYADFRDAMFSGNASFWGATLSGRASFQSAAFTGDAAFDFAMFRRDADFTGARLGRITVFNGSRFKARTLFLDIQAVDELNRIQISPGPEVHFTNVIIDKPDRLIFRKADLRKWRFLGTDPRKAEFTGVTWPEIGGCVGVYDDPRTSKDENPKWSEIERLYRELKQNFEERRDSDRAGDFHYGEKEMRRLNPETPLGIRWLLLCYRCLSGYGERYLLPLCWAALVLVMGTCAYYVCLFSSAGEGHEWVWTNWSHWKQAAIHTVRAMFLLRPASPEAVTGDWTGVLNTALSLCGPLVLGLLALAIRQRLRR